MPIAANEQLTLIEHLDELRKRIFACLIALVIGVVVAIVFDAVLFDLLLRPLPAGMEQITTFSPAEQVVLGTLTWQRETAFSNPPDFRRIREIDPRRLLGDLYNAMLRRLK